MRNLSLVSVLLFLLFLKFRSNTYQVFTLILVIMLENKRLFACFLKFAPSNFLLYLISLF